MCGRLNVIADPLCQWVSHTLGLEFHTKDNPDLRPTQHVATIASHQGRLQQLDTTWGIKPAWAKQILINAQAETVTEKPTFKRAFATNRCLIPCSGWYEWRQEDPGKVRYLFSAEDRQPLLMAGIYYPSELTGEASQLVTLTTAPTPQCAEYHNRMPLLIPLDAVRYWFNSEPGQLDALLHATAKQLLIRSS
ncbi:MULTISPECIES: SOS response-associated peptidase [Shewanella]|uniref:SOS response-associated peptidase n=1 Tax=Shewanella TaxID=22 RepID=UPI000B348B3B|nr:SOS response-associated peptidase [Shewanella algae]AYV11542.1 SOS response-associated peptidase [Shewanella algae]QXN27439.1 SOS response-associated peptidase [Shewanella putrefaciens]